MFAVNSCHLFSRRLFRYYRFAVSESKRRVHRISPWRCCAVHTVKRCVHCKTLWRRFTVGAVKCGDHVRLTPSHLAVGAVKWVLHGKTPWRRFTVRESKRRVRGKTRWTRCFAVLQCARYSGPQISRFRGVKRSTAGCAQAHPGAWEPHWGDHALPHGSVRAVPLVSLKRDEVFAARASGCKHGAPRRAPSAPTGAWGGERFSSLHASASPLTGRRPATRWQKARSREPMWQSHIVWSPARATIASGHSRWEKV